MLTSTKERTSTANTEADWWQRHLFAATPTLESKKLDFSASDFESVGFREGDRGSGMKIDSIDISLAFLQADASRGVFVEILPEVGNRECSGD